MVIKNKDGNPMTKEEAMEALEKTFKMLALTAINNRKLTDYVDELETYIRELDDNSKAE